MISTIQSFFMPNTSKTTINADTSGTVNNNVTGSEKGEQDFFKTPGCIMERILGTRVVGSWVSWTVLLAADKDSLKGHRAIATIISEMPSCSSFNHSLPKIKQFFENSLVHLKPQQELTEEEQKKVYTPVVHPFDVKEVRNFYEKVSELLIINYILKKNYEEFPFLDKKNFEDISAKIIPLSTEAVKECLYQYVGLKHLNQLTYQFLDGYTKEDWKSERWWLDKAYKVLVLDDAKERITYDKRTEFQKLFELCNERLTQLFKNPRELIEHLKLTGNSVLISQISHIHLVAYRAMMQMPGLEKIYPIYSVSMNFLLK